MKVSLEWLQSYFEDALPELDKLAELLTLHAFEVEAIEDVEGIKVLDIDILPNRANTCLSHYYIAQEIASLTGLPIKPIPHTEFVAEDDSKDVSINIEDENKCRRYAGQVMTEIKVGPSPEWLRNRLESVGQRSINNVVDATNYLMLTLNQPLHAFDLDKLDGGEIKIRNAEKGENFTTLDGTEVKLSGEELLIADGKNPLALAGIKGGNKAEVDESTENILIESANFDPSLVRKISTQVGIKTDSSKRFENNLSPGLVGSTINVVTALIQELAGGKIGKLVDIYPKPQRDYKIGISTDEVNKHLGTKLSEKEVEGILGRLKFSFEKRVPKEVFSDTEKYVGAKYLHGASITNDAPEKFDCSSFTSFLYVNAGVAIPRISVDQLVYGDEVSEEDMREGDLVFSNTGDGKIFNDSVECMPGTKVESGVDHCGMYLGGGKIIHATRTEGAVLIESLNESKQFTNQVGIRRYIDEETKSRYVVTVPNERMDLRNPGRFLKGGNKEDIFEEIGRIYGYSNIIEDESKNEGKSFDVNKLHFYEEKIREILTREGFSEVFTSSFSSSGEVQVQNPIREDRPYMRANLSANIEEVLPFNIYNKDLLGLSDIAIFEIGSVFNGDREYKSCAITIKKSDNRAETKAQEELVSAIKKLETSLGENIKNIGGKEVFEFNISELAEKLSEPKEYEKFNKSDVVRYKKISQYPFILRDIAVWLPSDVSTNGLTNGLTDVLTRQAGDLLVRTTLFDTYEKEGKISYAYRLVFQSLEKTLTDVEAGDIMKKIESTITEKGWEVR